MFTEEPVISTYLQYVLITLNVLLLFVLRAGGVLKGSSYGGKG